MAQQTTTRARTATAPAEKAVRRPARRRETAQTAREVEAAAAKQPAGVTIPVPTLGVRPMHIGAPGAVAAGAVHGAAGVSDAIRDRLPDRQHLLYYGGLGALAALGVLSWPAAAAIGTGVWIAGRAPTGGGNDSESAHPETSHRKP